MYQTCLLGWESTETCIQGVVGVKLIYLKSKDLSVAMDVMYISCNSASHCVINLEEKVSKAKDREK